MPPVFGQIKFVPPPRPPTEAPRFFGVPGGGVLIRSTSDCILSEVYSSCVFFLYTPICVQQSTPGALSDGDSMFVFFILLFSFQLFPTILFSLYFDSCIPLCLLFVCALSFISSTLAAARDRSV